MPIEVAVQGAYSKGGIPLNVHGIANVKIAGEQPVLDNAIERFLGVDRGADHGDRQGDPGGQPARRARHADARGAQPGQDQVRAVAARPRPRTICGALGLELDTLKIQDVSDDVNYLDSIGRKQSAEVQKKALIAEARAKAESRRAVGDQPPRDRDVAAGGADRHRARRRTRAGSPTPRPAAARWWPRRRARSRRGWPAPRASWRCRRRASSRCAASCRPTCWSRPAPKRAPPRPPPRASAAHDHRAGPRHRRGDGRDRRHLARGRPGRAQRLPDAEGDRSDADRDEHRRRR